MARFLKTVLQWQITDDAITDTNNVGGNISATENEAISEGDGFKVIKQANGAAAQQIFPQEHNGTPVGFRIYCKYTANEPAATKFFTLVENVVDSMVQLGVIGTGRSATDDLTIQTGAASPVTFYIQTFILE